MLIDLKFKEQNTLQHESEITEMINIVLAECEVKNVIEIGTFEGGTAYIWGQLVKPHNGKVYCIDVKFGSIGKAEPGWEDRCEPVYRGTDVEDYIVEILGQSQDPEVIKKVRLLLKDQKADLLFIDGDHNYESAKSDFENFSQFVKNGGWIAFHDILDKGLEVRLLWEEVKHQFESWELDIRKQPEEKRKSYRSPEKIYDGIGLIRWRIK
jgi:predicted O-methyltransferase YrrM